MAIVINSLVPVNPVIPAGDTVTFIVDAAETTGQNLSYEWQFSSDGGSTYTANGLFNNVDDTFTTSPLSQNQSGIYFRVRISNTSNTSIVFSNTVAGIGNRIVVVEAAPLITVLADYEPVYVVPVAANLNLQVDAIVLNIDTSDPNNLAGLAVQWQESYNNGDTWTNIFPGTYGNFIYSVTTTTYQISASPLAYGKRSILTLNNITFDSNNYQYRARLTYAGASNTPTIVAPTTILVNPTISIFQQPGINANDTKIPVQCYKTGIGGSGSLRVSVGAFTTSGLTIAYAWEFAIVDYNNMQGPWFPIQEGLDSFWFRFTAGTNGSSDVLRLDRVIYFEKIAFRAIISGSAGEVSISSDAHYIFMKDIQVLPENISDKQSLEDFYDPAIVPNSERQFFTQFPIQTVLFETYLNIARNTGLNGQIFMEFQRQNPGASTYFDLGVSASTTPSTDVYTAFPSNNIVPLDIYYTTPPLRINLDDQARYRIKITSTSVYTLNNGVKILTPFYSAISTLTVYRAIYITSQPTDVFAFTSQSAAFAVGATATSSALISFQWQDSTNGISGWTNIINGGKYSGANTNLLVITPIDGSISKRYFRCVVNTTNTLASSTSFSARLIIGTDAFAAITSLNDLSVDEYDPVTWVVEAQSESLGAIQYQWQKSVNFNPSSPNIATWTNITGETTDTFTIASVVSPNDEAYYRCRVTSFGGVVSFTNAAALVINVVEIRIIQNISTTLTFLESIENERTFTVEAIASRGPSPTYQWQIQRVGDTTFTDLGVGYQGQISTGRNYTPRAFDRIIDNGAKIRCRITAAEVPETIFSNECTITVNRRFYYFADNAIKNANIGRNFALNLSPSSTGGVPSFQWQRSTNGGSTWSNIAGETSSELLIINITSGLDGYRYRCQVTLASCSQYQYSRNNIIFIVSASSVDFTQSVELNVLAAPIVPNFYSKESQKNGAAVGTVICVPKPDSYINDLSSTIDDISLWKTSITGHISNTGTVSSTVLSGTVYNLNKPSWVTDSNYKSPKWILADDRFPGFIEIRGQWLLKSEFPILYKIIGNTYGSTTSLFRLPNLYGKKLMGTGNVNNNGGNVSVIPLFNPDGTSGGDKNEAGSIGGVWNYSRSAQLPPGSPGTSSELDGTAGQPDPATFSIGNFVTNGFLECEGTAETVFGGSFSFRVGPLLTGNLGTAPPHSHFGISAGAEDGYLANSNGCDDAGIIDPPFYAIDGEESFVIPGPEGVPEDERGLPHSHGLSSTPFQAGNGSSNHESGIGDTQSTSSVSTTINIDFRPGTIAASANVFLEPVTIKLTNASKPIFNSALQFYLRNNEELPVNSNYFRLKYMIKAY